MICEARVGVKLGLTNPDLPKTLLSALDSYGLVTKIDISNIIDSVTKAISRDKKKSGNFLKLPVVIDVGKWELVRISVDEFVRMVMSECGSIP